MSFLIESKTLRRFDIFRFADDRALEVLAQKSSIKNYQPNSVIIHLGDTANTVFFVIGGCVQVCLANEEGKKIVIKDIHPGDCFGELGVICQSFRCANIETKTETQVLAMEGKAYVHYCYNNLYAAKITIDRLASSLTKLTQDYQSLALNDLNHRLIRALIEVSERVQEDLVVKLTHNQLANRVAATRESVSRGISELCKQNLITSNGKKIVINQKLLDLYSRV